MVDPLIDRPVVQVRVDGSEDEIRGIMGVVPLSGPEDSQKVFRSIGSDAPVGQALIIQKYCREARDRASGEHLHLGKGQVSPNISVQELRIIRLGGLIMMLRPK